MNKIIKILQYMWLTIAITAIIVGVYVTYTKGVEEGIYFFIITLIGGIMYAVNKRRHKNYLTSETKKDKKSDS